MMVNEFDAIIIGSGFGGSVMAYRLAEAGPRLSIVDFRFPISNWRVANRVIRNWQLKIGNGLSHPLPRGGTDFMLCDYGRRSEVIRKRPREV